jgi:hypothetical protein
MKLIELKSFLLIHKDTKSIEYLAALILMIQEFIQDKVTISFCF